MQAPAARARWRGVAVSLRPLATAFGNLLDHEQALGYVLVAPVVLLLLGLVAYPFVIAVSMALTDRTIGNPGKFIGLTNIQLLLQDSIYLQAVHNTLIYTAGATVMKEILTIAGPTPDAQYTNNFPKAVKEWCINSAVVDPFTRSVLANNEDGKLYRWDLTANTLSETNVLTRGVGEAYTPTVVGVNGVVYAINDGILFAVGR